MNMRSQYRDGEKEVARRAKHLVLLDGLSHQELIKTKDYIDTLIATRREEARHRLTTAFEQLAKKNGFQISELFSKSTPSGRGRPAKVMYRHPKDPSLTWSGRGRPARWLADLVAKGHSRDEFKI
jgi:DNA-binding protein H-NS